MSELDSAARLRRVLEFVYKFPHNANLYEVMAKVYGEPETVHGKVSPYVQQKLDIVAARGFTYWWAAELDLSKQKEVAELILERYGTALENLLAGRQVAIVGERQHLGRHTLDLFVGGREYQKVAVEYLKPHEFEVFDGDDIANPAVWCRHCNTARDEVPGMHVVERVDVFGRVWPFPKSELCPTCGQPDSTGDCNHEKLGDAEVLQILGKEERHGDDQ